MLPVPKATKAPEIKRLSIKNWMKGVVTAFDDGRTPTEGLLNSSNVILEQDGTVRPRPSLLQYGPQPVGTVLGSIYEFRVTSGATTTNWMISLQNVSGTTKVYAAKGEDSAWTVCNGKTYDNAAHGHFLQVGNKVLVMNGVDTLSYLDTSTMAIVAYTTLSTPAAPTLKTNTGLAGTAFKVYYAVTANSTVGQTAGSPVLTQAVSKDRDLWDPAANTIEIQWSTVTGVKSWNVYMGVSADGAGQPQLYLIAGGLDAATLSFVDNGTRAQDVAQPLPTSNSTAGPKVTRGAVSNGRPFLVGDSDNPFYVWRGGDFGFELDFSPANGGGYTPVGNGTKDVPNAVVSFRNGKGDAQVMVLSQGTNGTGRRSYLNPTNVTYGNTSLIVWQVTEDSGQDGTDSPDGLIIYQNSAYYPSRDGFKTTGTKPQIQNVLSTDRISNTVQPDIQTLNTAAMKGVVGLASEGKLYWALPVSSTTNNQIWVLDLDRGGAWMKPWNISADWMTLYNDNSGQTHHLILQNNVISELTYVSKTNDNGTPFVTSGTSGQVKYSDDGRDWVRLIQVIFTLQRPQGNMSFTLTAKTEDGIVPYTLPMSFANNATRSGWSEPGAGWSSLRGWSEIVTVPVSFNPATEDVIFEVDEDVQWFQYGWVSTESGVDYNIADVVSEHVGIGIKDLS